MSRRMPRTSLQVPFQREVFADLLSSSGLCILARGLGYKEIVGATVELYSNRQALVFLLSGDGGNAPVFGVHPSRGDNDDGGGKSHNSLAGGEEEEHFRIVNNDTPPKKRMEIYLRGGVISITSRIMLIDLLKERIPIPLTTGIIILKAHAVSELGIEAFILDYFCKRNRAAFIKAFSDRAERLSSAFARIERIAKYLHTPSLLLYPRFHATVKGDLDCVPLQVEEISVSLTPKMKVIQLGLLDAAESCLKEIAKGNPTVDLCDLTIESIISQVFDDQVQRQLEPIWHKVTFKSRQLISDVKTIRMLLEYLVGHDSVSFCRFLETLIVADATLYGSNGPRSYWMMLDAAQSVVKTAKDRVYSSEHCGEPEPSAMAIELMPKWRVLKLVIDEWRNCAAKESAEIEGDRPPLLVMVKSVETANTLRTLLRTDQDVEEWKRKRFDAYRRWKETLRKDSGMAKSSLSLVVEDFLSCRSSKRAKQEEETLAGVEVEEESSYAGDASLVNPTSPEADRYNVDDLSSDDEKDSTADVEDIIFCTFPDGDDYKEIFSTYPSDHIVMYDVDLAFIRGLEMHSYCRHHCQGAKNAAATGRGGDDPPSDALLGQARERPAIKVTTLVYKESVEEMRQLLIVRREKEAFERLIRGRAAMPAIIRESSVEAASTAGSSIATSAHTGGPEAPANINTGHDDGTAVGARPRRVIVDIRELRSSLPFILYKAGFILEPLTIDVGDYILTDDICVERKSVSDLISSLASGRLYTQAEAMLRRFSTCILLIEFDEGKPFCLLPTLLAGGLKEDIRSSDVTSKLCLLLLHFPRLKLFWSSSLVATVDLFSDLKRGQPDPTISTGDGDEAMGQGGGKQTDPIGMDILRSLPGVDAAGASRIAVAVKNLRELATLSLDSIVGLLGREGGTKLHTFLHASASSLS